MVLNVTNVAQRGVNTGTLTSICSAMMRVGEWQAGRLPPHGTQDHAYTAFPTTTPHSDPLPWEYPTLQQNTYPIL